MGVERRDIAPLAPIEEGGKSLNQAKVDPRLASASTRECDRTFVPASIVAPFKIPEYCQRKGSLTGSWNRRAPQADPKEMAFRESKGRKVLRPYAVFASERLSYLSKWPSAITMPCQ